jgi:hypothetical protein
MKRLFLLGALCGVAVISAHAGVEMTRTSEAALPGGSQSEVQSTTTTTVDDGADSISRLESDKATALSEHPELIRERDAIKAASHTLTREQENGYLTAVTAQWYLHWKQAYQFELWNAMVQVDPQIGPLYPAVDVRWHGLLF